MSATRQFVIVCGVQGDQKSRETMFMKEKLYTIPLNDAVNAGDECPFCFIERKLEQNALDFALGSSSSYMESDIRDQTDRAGFCGQHMKKMFDYGNALGNALILQTHYRKLRSEMQEQFKAFTPGKTPILGRFRRTGSEEKNPIAEWTRAKDESCFICKNISDTFARYMETFFWLYERDPEFKEKILNSKGFCLHHFGILCENADKYLKDKEKAEFYPAVFELMEQNLKRIEEELVWFSDKFDYRNRDADWKNSKDALQRGMQKLRSGYPADPVYKSR